MSGEAFHEPRHEPDADVTPAPVKGEASDRHRNATPNDLIKGEAVHEKDGPVAQEPPEYELNQLRRLNREKADLIDGEGEAVQWLFSLCAEFINGCEGERLYHLVRTWDAQAVIKDLQADFHRFFTSRTTHDTFERSGRQAEDYYTIALELLALGVISHSNNNPKAPYHTLRHLCFRQFARAISDLNAAVNTIVHAYIDQETKQREDTLHHENDERCAAIENYSAHKEDDSDLAPAEKTRVLMRALIYRNECGWFELRKEYENYPSIPIITPEVHRLLNFHDRDRSAAEEFFTNHPHVSVSDVMLLAEDCVNVFLDAPMPEEKEHDLLWHARRGRNIPFLLRHSQKIAEELDDNFGTHHLDVFG